MNRPTIFSFSVNKENRTISAERSFNAPLDLVWAAWTEPEILDQWWAAEPLQAKTVSMDLTEGGRWHYSIRRPSGDKQWYLFEFEQIVLLNRIAGNDAFCDAMGNIDDSKPRCHWDNRFTGDDETATVSIKITLNDLADLEFILQTGIEEELTSGLDFLDHYISTQFKLRKQYKPNNMARVSTYLNFPGNTEEVFNFYKKVFKGEFTGAGLQRFGDAPLPADAPPMSEADKKLIIHAELTIMGGHVLMATDAPESMGFSLSNGNNMHINLEPDSREETERLFKELSAGGTVSMPLQDMFWGAYYGSFTDKWGINWMLNFQTR